MSAINSGTTNTSNVPNQPTNSLDLSQFQSGTTAQCIMALLELQSELAEISNLYGQQVMSQLQASNAVAKGLANIEVKIGVDQMQAALASGIGGMASGAASGLGLVELNGCKLEKAPIEEQITNAKTYQTELVRGGPNRIATEGRPLDNSSEAIQFKKDFSALKTNAYDRAIQPDEKIVIGKLTDDEHEELSKKVDKFISKKEAALERIQARNDQKNNRLSQLTNVLATTIRSASDIGQGVKQKDLGKDNAEKTYQSNALSQIQTAISEAAKHADEYVGSAQQVSQILTDINRSNQLN